MRKSITFNSFIAVLVIFVSSCSALKNPSASTNFKRVKYNSHVKFSTSKMENSAVGLNEKQFPITIKSFKKEERIETDSSLYVSAAISLKERIQAEVGVPEKSQIKTERVSQLLKKIAAIEINEAGGSKLNSLVQKIDSWWEDDAENWPWFEIALAVIAILVIAILVRILISLLGGFISSLLGLILLIALAYILYTLWV